MSSLDRVVGRRRFLVGAGTMVAGLTLQPHRTLDGLFNGVDVLPTRRALNPGMALTDPRHLAWVWQFSSDGTAATIRETLAAHNLGVVLKTHDGASWMSRWDKVPGSVDSAGRVADLAAYFEDGGVPFHAWCVVKGKSPEREAEMAAEVLDAGARSLFIDLEPHSGFWTGTQEGARIYGDVLRSRHPNAWIVTSLDPRPWTLAGIPLAEFAAFSDELAPQIYWDTFKHSSNIRQFTTSGYDPGPDGTTPGFLLDMTAGLLQQYGLPINPVGEGFVPSLWPDFVEHAYSLQARSVSVWRFGITPPEVWQLLRDIRPQVTHYQVEPGDSVGLLAQRWGTTAQEIIDLNGLDSSGLIHPGQVLRVPRGPLSSGVSNISLVPGGGTYVVQPGDTVSGLAERWGTSIAAVARMNGLADPDYLVVGQELKIP